MSKPTPERYQEFLGRTGECVFRATWTTQDQNDFDAELVMSRDEVTAKRYEDWRVGVKSIEWVKAGNFTGEVWFDSMPPGPDGLILAIPQEGNSGKIDLSDGPLGDCKPDPNPTSPGSIVISTSGALTGDDIYIRMILKEKGRRPQP